MKEILSTFITALIGTGFTLNTLKAADSAPSASQNARPVFNLQKFGRAGTGGDDTPVFRQAFAAAAKKGGIVRVPVSKTAYRVSPLSVPSNTMLIFDPGVVLQALPGYPEGNKLLNMEDVSNIQIMGYGAVVRMNRAEYKTGEYRHCLWIMGAMDVHIKGLTCADAGGAGIHIGASEHKPYSENILLEDVQVENSIGPALNLISGKNVLVRRCRFTHSHSNEARAGINVVPNRPEAHLENIRFEDNVTEANSGDGIHLMLSRLNDTSAPISITAARHRDKSSGESSYQGINDPVNGRAVHGYVLFENCFSEGAQQYGAVFSFWNSAGPKATVRGITVLNANESRSTYDNAAVAVKRGGGGTGTIGNVAFIGTTIRDTRPAPKLDYYFTFQDYSKVGITNVAFSNPGQLSGAVHQHPLGLFQGQGVDKIEKGDDRLLTALWQKAEHPVQLSGARASTGR